MTELVNLPSDPAVRELEPEETTWNNLTVAKLFFETHDSTIHDLVANLRQSDGFAQDVFLGYVPKRGIKEDFFIVGFDTNTGGAYVKVFLADDGAIVKSSVTTSRQRFYDMFREQLDVKWPMMISLRED